MKVDKTIFSLFKQGSRTYFYSSLFFPTSIRQNVFILYAFVRQADNYVDQIPQDSQGFYHFVNLFEKGWRGEKTQNIVVDSFVVLAKNLDFEKHWIDAFLASMEMDLKDTQYTTLDDTLRYIYGSAEVIGLFMAKILGLPFASYKYAKFLGRSMQYINFIRDIEEDNQLHRTYFPSYELEACDLVDLSYDQVIKKKDSFIEFIHKQVQRYCDWQNWAEKGYYYIPRRYLIPVKTASEMYKWTARTIERDPFMIYKIKVKPRITQIIMETFTNMLDIIVKKDQEVTCNLDHSHGE